MDSQVNVLSNGKKVNRILLKLSGEALMGEQDFGVCPKVLHRVSMDIAEIAMLNVQIAIVVGGGNIFRGMSLSMLGIDRVTGDQMGMLSTVMNALVLRDALINAKIATHVMSSIEIPGISPVYSRSKAVQHLNNNEVVIFSGGTGNPLFTTDTAACLRGIEINTDLVLKATKVDGVYSEDPSINPQADKYDLLTYDDVLEKRLKVMDLTAICLMREHNIPLQIFNMHKKGALKSIILGENEGTKVFQKKYSKC